MQYIDLDKYSRKWMFRNKDLPVSEADFAQIKPLTESSSANIWQRYISPNSAEARFFDKKDWPKRNASWRHDITWQEEWESDEADLPVLVNETIDWPQETVVYFCVKKSHVIETTWGVFQRHWKCFLFNDEGSLLISPTHPEALFVRSETSMQIGRRA